MSAMAVVSVTVSLIAGVVPTASATPGPSDLSDLAAVDNQSYYTYATYGMGGWQFVTPAGVRCRITTYNRGQAPPRAQCWGELPGVSDGINRVYATYDYRDGLSVPDTGFGDIDLDDLETYRSYDHRTGDEVDRVDPASYIPLPLGSKLFADGLGGVTCGVITEDELVCEIGGSNSVGFVLSPEGSSTF